MNQSCFSLGFFSQNSLWNLSTFHGLREFIIGYEIEYEKSFFSKIGCTGKSLMTAMSREFQLLVTRLGQIVLFVL